MYELNARKMLDWSEDEVWDLDPSKSCNLTFDDKTIKNTDVVDVQISWYFWQVSSFYSEVPVTSNLFLHGRPFTDGLARDLMNEAIQSTREFDHIEREDVWRIVYSNVYNRCFCAMATRLLPHISGTNGDDTVELLDDPQILEANEQVNDSLATVDHVYDIIEDVFKGPKYQHNPIVRAVGYGTVKLKQMFPSFGPRGRVTDIDSEIYRRPVKRGFAMGFTSIADFAKESRSAAKALLFNKDPVATAEYFNRKLQFVAAYIKELVEGDCGTKDYHTLEVPEGDSGRELLYSLDRLTRVYPDGRKEQHPIDPKDESQLGKTIHFRTTITCRHLAKQGVCEKCYGDLSYSIPKGDNPGHVSCTSVNEKITQLIISTKHLDFIIHNLLVRLNRDEQAYLDTNDLHPDMIYMNTTRKGEKMVMRVLKSEAPRLISVRYVDDTFMMNPSRTTQLTHMEFHHVDEYGQYSNDVEFDMVKRSTKASMSRELLAYIKKVGWSEDDSYYTIDMSKWDVKKPMFIYPHKHENMSEYGKRAERFIRSSREAGEKKETKKGYINMLTKYKDVDSALYDAFYLISDKIDGVYLGHIATILAATRAQQADDLNYNLPHGKDMGSFQTHDDIIKYRSLGVAMLFERHRNYFADVDSFIIKDRMPSILDDMIHLEEDKYPRTSLE